jgi:glycosyltransferase involved in cell wall biosynthesis
MYHHLPEIERLNRNTFQQLRDYDEEDYRNEIHRLSEPLEGKIRDFIQEHNINFLVVENIWSVALSLPLSIALTHVARDLELPVLAHNHDFYWERIGKDAPTCATAEELIDKYMPPQDPLFKHVVINSLTQRELAKRKGIIGSVVPNVFDFDAPPWQADEYNQDFRQRIGLGENDIMVLQATRIVPRKAIELGIEFVKTLGDPERRGRLKERGLYDGRPFDEGNRIVLVLVGYAKDDQTNAYLERLMGKIDDLGIDALHIDNMVAGNRCMQDGEKKYSLWDTYVSADFITYPSIWEGWGNQFLEAMHARLPLMLFEYPVYQADIKDKGFQVVSIGDEITGRDAQELVQIPPQIIESAADKAVDLLTDADLRLRTVERNLDICREHYSLKTLERHLKHLIGNGE